MKSLLLLVLHFGVVLAALEVYMREFYVAEEGTYVDLPCSYTSGERARYYGMKWKEVRGGYSFTIYHESRNGEGSRSFTRSPILTPPWRDDEEMKRFRVRGGWLYIDRFREEDQYTKCCEIILHNPLETAEACTDLFYVDQSRRGGVAGLYSDEGTDDTEAAAADKQYDCKCLQKVVALGVVAAISFFIMVGLIIYVVKYLKK